MTLLSKIGAWFARFKNPSAAFITQGAHFLFGYAVVMSAVALGGGLLGAVLATLLFLAYAVAKEVWYDPHVEDGNPFWPEGAKDLVFLVLGPLVAWVLLVLRWWVG